MPAKGADSLAVYLVFDGEPLADTAIRLKATGSPTDAMVALKARRAEIETDQARCEKSLAGFNARVTGRFHRLANALRVESPADKVAELAALPGVVRVERAPRHARQTSTSVPFVGAARAWSSFATGLTGEGVRVGIVDSGIDYTHADFGGPGSLQAFATNSPTKIEPGTFPTAKVVGGYDFCGDNYNADDPGLSTPHPDPDPLDCAASGHGTHVAGIAAGLGVLLNETTYVGSYTESLAQSLFAIGPGVAPGARLYALKVFGCSGTTGVVLDALEWATDPDNDNDFSDRLDVLNLSIGSGFGMTGDDVEHEAINRLALLGCTVAISAGNNGNNAYIAGSPGVAELGICVANSIDNGAEFGAIQVEENPGTIAALYEAVEGAFTRPLKQTGPIRAEVVQIAPADACGTVTNPSAIAGKIALIDRGTCFFVDKVRAAQQGGAIAVIMVNNKPGPPIAMGGSAADIAIPGVMITQADGALLQARLPQHPIVRLSTEITIQRPELADQIEESSSRGPASPANLLKPDLAAPGFNIVSAKAGAGFDGVGETGTSMASPHVAGALALLRQAHPGWSVADLKAALMNTAQPLRDAGGQLYPESRIGAGRIAVDLAARTPVTAQAEHSAELISLSFGALSLAGPYTETRFIELTNHSDAAVSYDVSATATVSENGCEVSPRVSTVTVSAHSATRMPVELRANPFLFDRTPDATTPDQVNGLLRPFLYEASGQIHFRHPDYAIHLPYHVALRAAAELRTGLTDFSLPVSPDVMDVDLPLRGLSAHPQPLVSVFQLGARLGGAKPADPALAVADLTAVGAASDIASTGDYANGRVYFGLAVSGEWTTPQSFVARFEVDIDVNRDGNADFRLMNSNAGNAANGGLNDPNFANDVLVTVLTRLSDQTQTTNGYVNVFGGGKPDTAPFNNSVLVLPVSAKALGLSAASPRFKYRVSAYGPQQRGTPRVAQTAYVQFDVAQPLIDGARFGLEKSPMQDGSQPLKVRCDRKAMLANGVVDAVGSVLLLHHANRTGTRAEIVRARFNVNDIAVPIQLLPVVADAGNGLTLRWTSRPGQSYAVERAVELGTGFLETITSDLPATPPFNSFQVPASSATGFFRIRQL